MHSEQQQALDNAAAAVKAWRQGKAEVVRLREEVGAAMQACEQLSIPITRIAEAAGVSTTQIHDYLGHRRPKPKPKASTEEFEAAWAALTEKEA